MEVLAFVSIRLDAATKQDLEKGTAPSLYSILGGVNILESSIDDLRSDR